MYCRLNKKTGRIGSLPEKKQDPAEMRDGDKQWGQLVKWFLNLTEFNKGHVPQVV